MNKYHAKKEVVDGITFDSRHEAARYRQLKLMEKAKAIQDLQTQVRFPLIKKSKYGREIVYVADFVYYENGVMVVEDAKSAITKKNPVYRLKKRMMAEFRNVVIKET